MSVRRSISRGLPLYISLAAALAFSPRVLAVDVGANQAAEEREALKRIDPMDTAGLDRGVANILRNYYRNNFTDASTWEQIESIRFDGTLHLPQGVLRFTAFKKKPDYCKVVIYVGNGGRVVMGYDGADAWQLNTLEPNAAPIAMPEGEALNFIRDATTGGHLFYPQLKGKEITLEGTADVNGQRAYHLQIQLPDGQLIHSFLDMTSFAEIRQITMNNVNGDEEVTTHDNFRQIDGISVPFVSTLTIDGQQIHQARMYRVRTDLGVMPWMFSRTSGADLPGDPEVGRHAPMPPSSMSESAQGFGAPFGAESVSLLPDIWAPSAFIDPDRISSEEIEMLSQQVGEPIVE